MVKNTFQRVQNLINELHRNNHIDNMTKNWLSQTPNPLRIPVFYMCALPKIQKPTPVRWPMISGCDGLTEQISFIHYILQSIAKSQKSYLKDTKDFINSIQRMKVPQNSLIGCHHPKHQYPLRQRYWLCMQSIRTILSKRNSNTNPHAQRNA